MLSNKLTPTEFVNMCLKAYPTPFIPPCHNIMYKLMKTFVIAGIHFVLKTNYIKQATAYTSRSVAMKMSLNNVKRGK